MRIRTDFIRSTVVVYSNYAAKCFTVSGSNPTGGIIFFSILNYVCDIVVKTFTFAISHLLMSACSIRMLLTGAKYVAYNTTAAA